MNNKKWATLFKIESTYGVDAAPVVANDLINTGNPKLTIGSKQLERNHPMTAFGTPTVTNIGETVKINFSMELEADWKASTDTVPSIGKVLRTCNFTETISTGSNIQYDNNSSQSGESATIYVYKDSLLWKVTGCRGEVKSSMVAGDKVVVEFEFTGKYKDGNVTDTTYPTFTVSLNPAVIFQNGEVAIGSYAAPIIQNMNWAMGNVIENRPDANSDKGIHSTFISNAIPTCSVDPEIEALATFNAFNLWENNTKVELKTVLKNPNTSTHKCTLSFKNMQYTEVSGDGERVGIMTYDLNFKVGGDADVSFKFEGDA